MIDFENLIRNLILPLVINHNDIIIEQHQEEDLLVLNLYVHPDDLGRVIGKGGKIAGAIRTICYAGATKEGIRVRVNIDSNQKVS